MRNAIRPFAIDELTTQRFTTEQFGHAEQVEATSQEPQFSLGELLSVCWHRRATMLSVAGGVAVLMFLSSLRTTPMYESHANLEVFLGTQPVQSSANTDTTYPVIDIARLNTQRERLLSTPVLARALETSDLRVGPAYAGDPQPVATLRSRLKVTTPKDSWVFEVSLQDEDRERARRGLQAVLDSFFTVLDDRAGSRASSAVTYLSQQVESARRRLDDARQDEQAFRTRKGILSVDPEDNSHARRMKEMAHDRVELDKKIGESQALLAQVRVASKLPDESQRLQALLRIEDINRHPVVVQQQQQLFQAEAEVTKLAPRYQYKHPRMKEAQLQVAAKRQQLMDAVEMTKASLEGEDAQLAQQAAELDQRLAEERKALDAYRTSLISLQSLSQETTTREQLLTELNRRLAEEDVASRLDSKQVVVNNPPEPAVGPVNIRLFRSLIMALFLGAACGVGAAFAREKLDGRIRGSQRARELTGLPMLGLVPEVIGLAALGRDGDADELPSLAAAYRSMRENLILTGTRSDLGRCLVVTSSCPGEGKSTVANRLAVSLAAAGARVLLVDADMRQPTQHLHVGVRPDSGLSSLLTGDATVAPVPSGRANLDFLSVGTIPHNPAELLYSAVLAEYLREQRNHYDYIICDTPPLMVTDALILAEQADSIMIVLRDRLTTRGALQEALHSLEPLRSKLIGFVLNDTLEQVVRDKYYYYGYGAKPAQPATLALATTSH